MLKRKSIIKKGDKFGRLTAIKFAYIDKYHIKYWFFKCDCGNEKIISISSVKNELTKSCGCLAKELLKKRVITHNMHNSREYHSWQGIKQRCRNKNDKAYKNYGGRGIAVCKRWLSKNGFQNFYSDMGNCPKGLTLDRINNNGNYEPNNCRWATMKEQENNKRNNILITYNNKTQTIAQWAKKLGINYTTLWMRLFRYNWSIEKTLE